MKIAVYTAIFGDKDVLRPPIGYTKSECIDYILFTDNPNITSGIYQIYLKDAVLRDVAKNARYYKIIGDIVLKDYDILIWHDANIQLVHDQIQNLVKKGAHTFLTTFKHPHRSDFYSEAMSCIRTDKDFSLRIFWQALVYFIRGMPAHYGMYSTGILIKNYSFAPDPVLPFWWHETLKHSRRDQLSFTFTVFNKKLNVHTLGDDIFNNMYSVYHKHNYLHYKEKANIMTYNYHVLKKLCFFGIQVMRKIKKTFR